MGLWGGGPVLQLIENCIFYIYGKMRDCATHDLPYHHKSTCCSLTNGINVGVNLIKSRLISCRMVSISLAKVKGEPGITTCSVHRSGCCVSLALIALPTCLWAGATQQQGHDSWNKTPGYSATCREGFSALCGEVPICSLIADGQHSQSFFLVSEQ